MRIECTCRLILPVHYGMKDFLRRKHEDGSRHLRDEHGPIESQARHP